MVTVWIVEIVGYDLFLGDSSATNARNSTIEMNIPNPHLDLRLKSSN